MPKEIRERIIDQPLNREGRDSGFATRPTPSGSGTVNDHSHDGASNSGGQLFSTAGYAGVLKSIAQTIQAAMDRIDNRAMMVKTSVESGDTLNVPSGWQMIVHGTYSIDGTIELDGDLILL